MTYPLTTQKLLDHPLALAGMVRRLAIAAGSVIMDHYDPSGFQGTVDLKADDSPVTLADRLADDLIRAGLTRDVPGIPMLTEETVDQVHRALLSSTPHYWLVDGLDGTKAFRQGNPDFTVNIALVHDDTPIMGIIYAPAHGEGYGGVVGHGALRFRDDDDKDRVIQTRPMPAGGAVFLTSVTPSLSTLTDDLMGRMKVNRHIKRHSSIKYCDVARGAADIMAAARDVYFWDSAAGDALVRAAGGVVLDFQGAPLRYDRTAPGFLNTGLVVAGDADYARLILTDATAPQPA